MFDTTSMFARWFKPVAGGYLYNPRNGAGGKLVTADEYENLVAGWQRAAGPRAIWMGVGLVFLALVLWTLFSKSMGLPDWTSWIILIVSGAGVMARIYWAAFAPARLVKDRADHAPPLSTSEFRKEARTAIRWPLVLFVLALSATAFIGHIINGNRSPTDWAWLVGSGLFFAAYMRIAILKLRDRRS